MSKLGFPPGAVWSDPRTGQLTPDAQRFIQQIILSQNGEGAGATIDGIQPLTNKTIDGNRNTLENIETNSLKSRTGEDNTVVTGAAGRGAYLAQWSESGDLTEGPEALLVLTEESANEMYLRLDENFSPIPMPAYAVAELPSASEYPNTLVYVSNETGGATLAISDGTNWRRMQDRVVVS